MSSLRVDPMIARDDMGLGAVRTLDDVIKKNNFSLFFKSLNNLMARLIFLKLGLTPGL